MDLCQESLDQYSDEQMGAAARNVIRDCRKVLHRFFALTPTAAGEQTGCNCRADSIRPLSTHWQCERSLLIGVAVTGRLAGDALRRCHNGPAMPNSASVIVAPAEVEVA